MGNCKDCRAWDRYDGICNAPDWESRNAPIGETDFVIFADAHDDSGLDAGLKTGPLFGCVQFQQKTRTR